MGIPRYWSRYIFYRVFYRHMLYGLFYNCYKLYHNPLWASLNSFSFFSLLKVPQHCSVHPSPQHAGVAAESVVAFRSCVVILDEGNKRNLLSFLDSSLEKIKFNWWVTTTRQIREKFFCAHVHLNTVMEF